MKRLAVCMIPVALGILFTFYYIGLAGENVVYTDYIRLINSYLPDVTNPEKFFVPDILTRVPLTYLGRIVNVKFFGYNTFFDMGLGVLSLGLGGTALAWYASDKNWVTYPWLLAILLTYFSLNKWEMLTNGTGWVCFLSISGFIVHYAVLDRAVRTNWEGRGWTACLLSLPGILTLLVAGPYCGGYSAILVLAYGALWYGSRKRGERQTGRYLLLLASVLVPLLLYLWSNSQAVYVHRGAKAEGSILSGFLENPLFFVIFLLKGLASSIVGEGQMDGLYGALLGRFYAGGGSAGQAGAAAGGDIFACVLGAVVACGYLYALYLNWRLRLWEKTILPLILILSGGLNHLLILVSRWIFLNDSYGMSSRYAIQYQMGIIGILLTLAAAGKVKKNHRVLTAALSLLFAVMVLGGNLYTTRAELQTAPYRKLFLKEARELGLCYRTAGDEELELYFQHDAGEIRQALEILEENHLNLFRREESAENTLRDTVGEPQ